MGPIYVPRNEIRYKNVFARLISLMAVNLFARIDPSSALLSNTLRRNLGNVNYQLLAINIASI